MLLNDYTKDKESTYKEKVILDCDMGFMNDDMLALSLLLQAEKEGRFEIAGITLEGGNVFIDAEYETEGKLKTSGWKNTKSFLKKVGCRDIPVYRGTDYPTGFNNESLPELIKYFENMDYLPFDDGYGAIHAYEKTVSGALCDSNDATNFMINCVKNNPGNVVIIAIGPTMNIAKAIEQDSSFSKNVKAIYYMGGAMGECYETETMSGKKVNAVAGANVSPYAEYNALYDPLALEKCITADFPQQFLSPAELNVHFDGEAAKKLKNCDCKLAQLWYEFYENQVPQFPYWDPMTVLTYLQPSNAVLDERKYITVNTNRKDNRFGETTTLGIAEYNALSEQDKLRYGKVAIIKKVNHFWGETIRLLCQNDDHK